MCGICGIVYKNNRPVDTDLLKRMCDVVRHRGPDDEGFYINEGVGLGVRRLSVIDLVTGHQPIHNEDESIWVILNGEIYNFLELRQALEKKSHRFYTKTDTEVIVHLYEEFGDRCVEKVNGMFAFAIWDQKSKRLFLARDRIGIKPLFYYSSPKKLAFGSEIKSILQSESVKPTVNLKALHDYLTYNYVPAPATMFEGIQKLLPGHTLIYQDGRLEIKRYWDYTYIQQDHIENDIYANLYDRFKASVKQQLISDVPLGVLLSGGIDSSLLVAAMTECTDERIKTFSIGFEESTYNELPYARTVARHFGTDHHELIVKPDMAEVIPKVIWHLDDPLADSSALPTYYLCKMAREHVTVALSGEGGDELFAGYDRYRHERVTNIIRLIPAKFREGIIKRLAKKIPRYGRLKRYATALEKMIEVAGMEFEKGYGAWVNIFTPEMKFKLYSDYLQQELNGLDSTDMVRSLLSGKSLNGWPNTMLYCDTRSYLPDDLLVKVDRMSMAHSLELRVPYLDHTFVEFVAGLPFHLKLRGLESKHLLRKCLTRVLPDKRVTYRGKRGFNLPVGIWLKNDLKNTVQETLLSSQVKNRGYFEMGSLQGLLQQHFEGVEDHGNRIWALLCFEWWARMFVDRKEREIISI